MIEPAAASDSLGRIFGPTFCISLASRPERRSFCWQQFKADQISVDLFDAIVPDEASRFPSLGAFGCYQSHARVLELGLARCVEIGADRLTIFEDDVLLPRGFSRIAKAVAPHLDILDWHIFYWGTLNQPPTQPIPDHEPVVEITPEQTVIGKQAYTIRASIVGDLLDHLRECGQRPAPGYSDGMFHEFRLSRGMAAHTHTLSPARQGSFASSITPTTFCWMRGPARVVKRKIQIWTR